MTRHTSDKERFEAWDGGHCYLRALRDHEGHISISRFPERASQEDIVKLGEWAGEGPKKKGPQKKEQSR